MRRATTTKSPRKHPGASFVPALLAACSVEPRASVSFHERLLVEAGTSRVWGGSHVPDDFDGGRRLGHCLAALDRPEHVG